MSEETFEETMARKQREREAEAAAILQQKLRARAQQPVDPPGDVPVTKAGHWV